MGEAIISRRGGGSNVKSVQSGTYIMNPPEASKDITISTVNASNCIILVSGSPSSYAYTCLIAGHMVDNSTINVSRSSGSTFSVTISWQVIEFNAVKSIQRGTYTMDNGTWGGTASITEVNLLKTFLIFSWKTNGGTVFEHSYAQCRLTDNSTLSFSKSAVASLCVVDWQLIEFK